MENDDCLRPIPRPDLPGPLRVTYKPIMTNQEMVSRAGTFFDESVYRNFVQGDLDAYKPNGELLFAYRRDVLDLELCGKTFDALEGPAKKARTESRRQASGGADYVRSMIAGYYDRPAIRVATKFPCRTTAFTRDNFGKWSQVVPLIQAVDHWYEKLEPKAYKYQREVADRAPQFQIEDTAFSTITVNHNWRTACHVDKGDFKGGYSGFTVCGTGWEGCYLGYPQYGVCVDVREGDVLLMNPHEYHCNTEAYFDQPDASRVSIVMYLRQGMAKCGGLN